MSTSLLVSTGAVSCYPTSMVSLIWFTNEECLSCQHWATWGHQIGHFVIQKCNHFASSVCYCTVLLEHVKDQRSTQTRKCDHFACFCGCNCKTAKNLSSTNQIFYHRSRV